MNRSGDSKVKGLSSPSVLCFTRPASEPLVHFQSGCILPAHAHHLGWHPGHGRVRGDIVKHHTAGPDFRPFADLHPAEDLGPCPEEDPGAHDRVTIAGLLAAATERQSRGCRPIVT